MKQTIKKCSSPKSALAGCLISSRRPDVDIRIKEVSETYVPCLKLLPLDPTLQPLEVCKQVLSCIYIYICIYTLNYLFLNQTLTLL
jgi:hypothetical protein